MKFSNTITILSFIKTLLPFKIAIVYYSLFFSVSKVTVYKIIYIQLSCCLIFTILLKF